MTVVVDRKRWYLPDTVYVDPENGRSFHHQFCRVVQAPYSRDKYIPVSLELAMSEHIPPWEAHVHR